MNQQLIDDNKQKLEGERDRLRGILGKNNSADGEGEFPGEFKPKFPELGREDGENASEVEQYANNLGETQALEQRLALIEKALQRIADGTYGQCPGGDEIEEERLRAVPEAETCTKHAA